MNLSSFLTFKDQQYQNQFVQAITYLTHRNAFSAIANGVVWFDDHVGAVDDDTLSDDAKLYRAAEIKAYIAAQIPDSGLNPTGNINMNGFRFINMGAGVDPNDSITKAQLDAAVLALDNEISKILGGIETLSIAANAVSWDMASNEPFAVLELTQNVTDFEILNQPAGTRLTLIVKQDATGGRTLAIPDDGTNPYQAEGGSMDINSAGNSYTVIDVINGGAGYKIVKTDKAGGGSGNDAIINKDYAIFSDLTSNQGAQVEGQIYLIPDASGHSQINSGYAYFEKLTPSTGAESDYRILSAEEDRGRITALENTITGITGQAYNVDKDIFYETFADALADADPNNRIDLLNSINGTTVIDINVSGLQINFRGNVIKCVSNSTAVRAVDVSANGVRLFNGQIIREATAATGGFGIMAAVLVNDSDNCIIDVDMIAKGRAQCCVVWGDNNIINGKQIQEGAGYSTSNNYAFQTNRGTGTTVNGPIVVNNATAGAILANYGHAVKIAGSVYMPIKTSGFGILVTSQSGDPANTLEILGDVFAPAFTDTVTPLIRITDPTDQAGKTNTLKLYGFIYAGAPTAKVLDAGRADTTNNLLAKRSEYTNGTVDASNGIVLSTIFPDISAGISHAPSTGDLYASRNGAWEAFVLGAQAGYEKGSAPFSKDAATDAAEPAAGDLKVNAVTPSTATVLRFSYTDNNALNIFNLFAGMKAGYVIGISGSDRYGLFSVASAAFEPTSFAVTGSMYWQGPDSLPDDILISDQTVNLLALKDIINVSSVDPSEEETPVYSLVNNRYETRNLIGLPRDNSRVNLYLEPGALSSGSGSAARPFNNITVALQYIEDNYADRTPVTLWIKGDWFVTSTFTMTGNYDLNLMPYPGEEVNIYGWERIENFTLQSGTKYRGTITDPSNCFNLVIDDEMAPLSKEGQLYEYQGYTRVNANSAYLESTELTSLGEGDNAYQYCKVDLKFRAWNPVRIEKLTGNIQSSGRLLYDPTALNIDANIAPDSAITYYMELLNREDWISANDEWAHDPPNRHVYLQSASNPNSREVYAVRAPFFLVIGNTSLTNEITLRIGAGITFQGFGVDAIEIFGIVHDCVIPKEVVARHCNRNGMTINGSLTEENNYNNKIDMKTEKTGSGGVLFFRSYKGDFDLDHSCYDTDEHLGFHWENREGIEVMGVGFSIVNFTAQNAATNLIKGIVRRAMTHGVSVGGDTTGLRELYVENWGRNGNDCGAVYVGGAWSFDTLVRYCKFGKMLNNGRLLSDPAGNYTVYSDFLNSRINIIDNVAQKSDSMVHLSLANDYTTILRNVFANASSYIFNIQHLFSSTVTPGEHVEVRRNVCMIVGPDDKALYYNANFDLVANPYNKGVIDENAYLILNGGACWIPRLNTRNITRMEEGVSLEMFRLISLADLGVEYEKNSVAKYSHIPEYNGLSSPTSITDNFGGADAVMSTSDVAGGYTGGGAKTVTLTGSNVVPDGQAFRCQFDAVASTPGVCIDIRLFAAGSVLLRANYWAFPDEDGSYSFYWVNDTGSPVTLSFISFRVRGYESGNSVSVTIRSAGFSTDYGVPGALLDTEIIKLDDPFNPVSRSGPYQMLSGLRNFATGGKDTAAIITTHGNPHKAMIDIDSHYTEPLAI